MRADEATHLVFEDIHWADPALLDLIEPLAARLHDLPVLFLTLARPELLDMRPAWGGGLLAYNALPLEPARRRGRARARAPPPRRRREGSRVVQVAEGNPLFIEQLAAAMSETRRQETDPADDVRGLVAARLDALPAAERERPSRRRRSSGRSSGGVRSSH